FIFVDKGRRRQTAVANLPAGDHLVAALKDDIAAIGAPLGRTQQFATAKDEPLIAAVHVDQVEAVFAPGAGKGDLGSVRADRGVKAVSQVAQRARRQVIEIDI